MASLTAQGKSKIEQIVIEFLAKSLQIVLESRIPGLHGELGSLGHSSSSASPTKRDKWFNLALGDCTAALANFEPWRRNLFDPLVVDIILHPVDISKSSDAHQGKRADEGCSSSLGDEILLERWIVQFEPVKNSACSAVLKAGLNDSKDTAIGRTSLDKESGDESGNASGRRTALPMHVIEVVAVYKRTVIMLRSLYTTSRLLPAYRLFRLASTPSNCCTFELRYLVLGSVSLLSEHEKGEMKAYSFTPVETAYGRMCLAVTYRHTAAVTATKLIPSTQPRIIPDYVGSPTTDPLKRFIGEPHSLPSGGICLSKGVHLVSVPTSLRSSPMATGFDRRHSWSGRLDQMQPVLQPPSPSYRISRPLSPFHNTPSPPYLPSPVVPHSRKHLADQSPPHFGSPVSSAERVMVGNLIGAYKHGPSFSTSPSTSPPTTYVGSSPVSIPKPGHGRGSKYPLVEAQQQYRSSLPPRSPSTRKNTQSRSSSQSPNSVARGRSYSQQSRSFESPKQFDSPHDDSEQVLNVSEFPFSIETIFRGQSRATATALSRSSSRSKLCFDAEYEDFSCPFAVDDVEFEEKASGKHKRGDTSEFSASSQGNPCKMLQDAAVGVLMRELKSAPPLRSPFSLQDDFGNMVHPFVTTMTGPVGLPKLDHVKTAVDALNELQHYRSIRDGMLRQFTAKTKHE